MPVWLALSYFVIIHLWNVDYVVDIVLGEIMKMSLQSNAEKYVYEKIKVKTVSH